MKHAKYIIFDDGLDAYPVIFPMFVDHAGLAAKIGHAAVTAGFVRMVNGQLEAYGESLSLGLKAGPKDTEYINRTLGFIK